MAQPITLGAATVYSWRGDPWAALPSLGGASPGAAQGRYVQMATVGPLSAWHSFDARANFSDEGSLPMRRRTASQTLARLRSAP